MGPHPPNLLPDKVRPKSWEILQWSQSQTWHKVLSHHTWSGWKTAWILSVFFLNDFSWPGQRWVLFVCFFFWHLGPVTNSKELKQYDSRQIIIASPAFIPASERLNYRYFQFVIPLLTDYKHYCTISKKPGAFGFSDQVASWQSFTTLQKPSLNSATTLPRSLTDI